MTRPDWTLDPYAVLGVGRDATRADIDRAFSSRRLLLHPDRTAGLSRSEQETAAQLLEDVLIAYDLLSGAGKRAAYDAKMYTAAPSPEPQDGSPREGPPDEPAPPGDHQASSPPPRLTRPNGGSRPEPATVGPKRNASISLSRFLGVLAVDVLLVGPLAHQATLYFVPAALDPVRAAVAAIAMAVFAAVALKRSGSRAAFYGAARTPSPIAQAYVGSDYPFDDEPQRPAGRITAEEYTRRADQERREAAEKARWQRAEREASRARKEAEQYHRDQRNRQARIDAEWRRQYNRSHTWGHR